MVEMYPVTYSTSDGLTIEGYLSLPNGASLENHSLQNSSAIETEESTEAKLSTSLTQLGLVETTVPSPLWSILMEVLGRAIVGDFHQKYNFSVPVVMPCSK